MNKTFRPMKAVSAGDFATLRYPLIAQPKIDGIRCVTSLGGKVLTCALKPIPNKVTRESLEGCRILRGLDGELVLRGAQNFGETSSAIMSRDGYPDVVYFVFDDLFLAEDGVGYEKRLSSVHSRFPRSKGSIFGNVEVLSIYSKTIHSPDDLSAYEEKMLEAGYEGLILRDPKARYKYGRSTRLEQGMLKVKRFEDAEAEIIGFEPLYTNTNPQECNELGLAKRSSKKAGKRRQELLGKLLVRDLKTGVEFGLGAGFTAGDRKEFWRTRQQLVGQLAKYRSQPYGKKEAPRIAVFLGIRSKEDLGC